MAIPKFHPSLVVMEDRVTPATPTTGVLDPSFGTGGQVVAPLASASGLDDAAGGVAIQEDGKIVLTGFSMLSETNRYELVARRLNRDGTVDASFGNNGRLSFASNPFERLPDGIIGSATPVTILTDSSILIATNLNRGSLTLVKVTSSGQLDSSYGSGGFSSITIGEISSPREDNIFLPKSITRLSNGNILVAGDSTTTAAFVTLRLSADGHLDNSFGNGGKAIFRIDEPDPTYKTSFTARLRGVAIQSDGRIVLAGTATSQGTSYRSSAYSGIAVARLTANGQLDTTFGSGLRVC